MRLRTINAFILTLMMAVFVLSSCSEDNNETIEFDNWQAKNEQAFADTLAYAQQRIAQGDTSWKVIRNWSLQDQTANEGASTPTYGDTDYIVVHVLEEGAGSGSPLISDTTRISYRGRLLPSTSYESGYVFDQTYEGTFDKTTIITTKWIFSTGIDGFNTALLNMHIGDRWMVYIPYQLAYGEEDYNGIPGHSLLRFEIMLHNYWRPGGKDPGTL